GRAHREDGRRHPRAPGRGGRQGGGPRDGRAVNWRWVWRQVWPILATLGLIVLLWWALNASGAVSSSSLPSPATVWTEFWRLVRDGTIPTAAGKTVLRLLVSFGVALVLGTLVGF